MVDVHVRSTGTPVDSGLDLVATFLSRKLAGAGPHANPAGLRIDVAALDLPAAPGSGPTPAIPAESAAHWYTVHVHRAAILTGPMWTVGDPGPCPWCLAMRWTAIRSISEIRALEQGGGRYVAGELPGITPFVLDTLWALVGAELSDGTAKASVSELRYDSLELRRHPLLADSTCPVCARPEPDTAALAAITLAPRPKRSPFDQRLTRVNDYDLPIDAYANPVCGALSDSVYTGHHIGTTAPAAGAFRSFSKHGVHDVHWGGHGTDYRTSIHCGLLEGLERQASLQARSKPATVYDSYANLATDALDPLDYGVYADAFYDSAEGRGYRRYEPDQKMYWVWGYSLRDQRPVLVPEQLAYYLDRRAEYPNFVHECSNGCASGGCLEEAILYGLLELIERDAFLLNWYGRGRPKQLDLASCTSPETHAMADRLDYLGYDTHLFDIRVDLPVPAVMAVVSRRGEEPGRLCFSAGAGLDPEAVVAAALRESASYAVDLASRVERAEPRLRAMAADYHRVTELAHHSLLYGLPEMAQHAAFLFDDPVGLPIDEAYKGWSTDHPPRSDLTAELRSCLDLVHGLGMDTIVVDQTSPEQRAVGVSTACVIVPGLLPIDFGWRRQRALHLPRLRTAFRTVGWRDTDLRDDELHLHPHPFP